MEVLGEKVNKANVVTIVQDSSDKIVWLESGHLENRPSGLTHIIDALGVFHAGQHFANDALHFRSYSGKR